LGSYWHGDRSFTYQSVMNEHNGTHVDAPAHFISDAKPGAHVTIENVLLNRLMGRAVRLDCRKFREGDYVSSSFVAEWEAVHGPLRQGNRALQLRLVGLLGAASQLWKLRRRLAWCGYRSSRVPIGEIHRRAGS